MTAVYVYVDGESHFIRSESCSRELFGSHGSLEELVEANQIETAFSSRTFLYRPASFFWDVRSIAPAVEALTSRRVAAAHVDRRIYFTSCVGDDDQIHEAKVRIRGSDFEPVVVPEPRERTKQRDNERSRNDLIEKAKGVDISLTTRLLEDSHHRNFDACCLFTSDVDFLPVIQALKRTGKIVYVFGYRRYLGKRSPFVHEPDSFFDLEETMIAMRNPAKMPK